MIGYTSEPYRPDSPPLVIPWVPDGAGYALLPGETCPCGAIPLTVGILSRNYRIEHSRCPGNQREQTVTTYTKDEWDGVSDEALWDAAWETVVHTEVWEPTGTNSRGILEAWNLARPDIRVESQPCPTLEKVTDEWVPGPFVENPGVATYTADPVVENDPFPTDVPVPSSVGTFEGIMEVGGSGFVISRSDDGASASSYQTEWQWIIDLTYWPETGEWPEGYVCKGRIVWWEATKDFDNDDPGIDFENPWAVAWDSTSMQSEDFVVTEDARVWVGEARISFGSGALTEGNTRIGHILTPMQPYLFLPFP